MAASLNSQNNQFVFSFPTDFVPRELQVKYKERLERMHSIFSDIIDYLNNSILGISFPGLEFPTTTAQTRRYGKEIVYKSSKAPYDIYTKNFSIKLESVDNYANYFIIQDILMWHYIHNNSMFVNPFLIQILDKNRAVNWQYAIREIVFTKLGSLNFAYSETEIKASTFEIGFTCNYIDFEYMPDLKMPSLIKTKL